MLNSMDFLISHLDSTKNTHKDNATMKSQVMTCWFKFANYSKLTDDTPMYAAAV